MQLFFSNKIGEKEILLDEEESRHAFSVLRKKEGDMLDVMDGKGGLFHCLIAGKGKKEALLHIQSKETHAPRPQRLHIAIAPTKNIDRTEWFVEKSIELGIEQISFLNCDRSERKHLNLERMNKIALSACKQSYSFHFPVLGEMLPLEGFLKLEIPGQQRLIASCEADAPLLDKGWQPPSSLCVLIGPEGDFSPREYQLLKSQGWQPISLGQKRLRTETAALAVCDRINFIFGG